MMKQKLLSLLVLFLFMSVGSDMMAESQSGMSAQTYRRDDSASLSYWLYTPANASAGMSLVVYLHGGSGKGEDLNMLIENDGFPKYLYDGELGDVPAYVIIPQLPSSYKGWSNIAALLRDLIVSTCRSYGLDVSRVALTGHSMGGTGVWSVAAFYPNLFHRIAPLSGSIVLSDTNLAAISLLDVWAVVGSDDTIVNPQSSIDFVNALIAQGCVSAQITVLDGATHFDIPSLAYKDLSFGLIDWLTNNSRDASIEAVYSADRKPSSADRCFDLLGRPATRISGEIRIEGGHLRLY